MGWSLVLKKQVKQTSSTPKAILNCVGLFIFAGGFIMPKVAVQVGALDSLLQASFVVQITLLILVLLSVFCWGVAITKFFQFREIKETNTAFLNRFFKTTQLDTLFENIDSYKGSPLARIFKAGYIDIQKQKEGVDIESFERALRKVSEIEIIHLESKMTLLATTGSTGPFIGLFGTVWGIMGSFHKIGQTGSASLAVVAPGISEALITTAIGLVAAIPAVVLYNNFVAKIRREEIQMNNFISDFVALVKRNKV